jgi:carboxylate-amine ligase
VRVEAEREPVYEAAEVLDENRFIAARDGMEARLVEPAACTRRPVRDRLAELLEACAPAARELGCADELADVERLAECPGAARQRAMGRRGFDGLVEALSREFSATA